MQAHENNVIVSAQHFDLSDALKRATHEKTEKLFAHENHIVRLRVDFERNKNGTRPDEFVVRGHIEIRGSDLVASVGTEDPYKSLDKLVVKLDRMLRRRSRLQKVKRKSTHSVEIPAEIPKAYAM